jgi:hypothetical protein
LDGFDELLQVTGVSQSDYLEKVAAFQQREADQGRPVVAVVTSRSAVADRARYPAGAVALRLEPFRPDQVDSWLAEWNRRNSDYLRIRGLSPLPAQVVAQHSVLAAQPLLLLMLALYDADANALQRDTAGASYTLDEAELYEQLLVSFVEREVRKEKEVSAWTGTELAERVEQELLRLGLAAFSMINRRQQWVAAKQLDSDLAAILPASRPVSATESRTPLTEADITLGRFFFIQSAQAIREGALLRAFEFLHATFGEYLAARLIMRLCVDMLGKRPPLTIGPAVPDDKESFALLSFALLSFALLSFAPLTSRQVLRFLRGSGARVVPAGDRRRLAKLLITLVTDDASRTERRFAAYQPASVPVAARHAIYTANLLMLILVLKEEARASELFSNSVDPAGAWHRLTLLWQSALTEEEWTELALSLTVRRDWTNGRRDLGVRLSGDDTDQPARLDPYWLFRHPPGQPYRGDGMWNQSNWHQIRYKMDVAGGTDDAIVRHALAPVFDDLGFAMTAFTDHGSGPASSVAHDLIRLWLASALATAPKELAKIYSRCAVLLARWPESDIESRRRLVTVVLSSLRNDADRLPANIVVSVLRDAADVAEGEPRIVALVRATAQVALRAEHLENFYKVALRQILDHVDTMDTAPFPGIG